MTETASYLGSAWVTGTRGRSGQVEVALPERDPLWARLATTFHPSEGDEVLVLSLDGEQVFVIGILRGSARLRVTGDFSIEAPKGTITMSAPHIRWEAGKLEVAAHRIVQRARGFYGWVSNLFRIQSRRMKTLADEDYTVRARTARVVAEREVKIDGTSIELG